MLLVLAVGEISSLSQSEVHHKKSGLMGSGFGVTIGMQKVDTKSQGAKESVSQSHVGSLHGDTLVAAGESYQQVGSTVSAPEGNTIISAKRIGVEAAKSRQTTDTEYSYQQKGLTVALNAPVLSAIQGAVSTVSSVKDVGVSQNNRVNAMAVANSGFKAVRTGRALNELAQNPSDVAKNVSVSITYGQQKNTNESHQSSTDATPSQVLAGGKVVMLAKGSEASDINVTGSDVYGKGGTHLKADHEINLEAAETTETERTKNKSAGWNAGVAISVGSNGYSLGVTAGGNYGRGHGNGDTTNHRATHVGSLEGNTTLESGETTTLKGAQVQGKHVELKAKDLAIESVQDTFKYDAKQMNASAQITVGYGFSASASFTKSKLKADYASVAEQAGILAGDEGYNVDIQNHTSLKGGLVTSTQKAEDEGKNRFSTGTLTSTDIENHNDVKGSAIGLDVAMHESFDGGKPSSTQNSGESAQTNDASQSNSSSENAQQVASDESLTKKPTEAEIQQTKDSWGFDPAFGSGKVSESESGTTKSGINTKNLTVREDSEGDYSSLRTSVTTDNYRDSMGAVEKNFEKEKLLEDLNVQVRVTKDFRKNISKEVDRYFDKKQADLRLQREGIDQLLKGAQTKEEVAQLRKQIDQIDDHIYELQYSRHFANAVMDLVAANPKPPITQNTLRMANTYMRQQSVANSKLSPGITDGTTTINNLSYSSGSFDGYKLGGTRNDVYYICGKDGKWCKKDENDNLIKDFKNNYLYKDDNKISLSEYLSQNKEILGGMTGGFQPVEGDWILGNYVIPYVAGGESDLLVEAFAGMHDALGGQFPGFYGSDGNTIHKTRTQRIFSNITTTVAIPVTMPFAFSDNVPNDVLNFIFLLSK